MLGFAGTGGGGAALLSVRLPESGVRGNLLRVWEQGEEFALLTPSPLSGGSRVWTPDNPRGALLRRSLGDPPPGLPESLPPGSRWTAGTGGGPSKSSGLSHCVTPVVIFS